MRFKDKAVIVTGAASGIGEASARAFSAEGAHVVVADFSERGQGVANELSNGGAKALYVKTDVSDTASVQRMVQQAVSTFGRIDVLFANAGIAETAPIDQLPERDWQRIIDINLTGVFLCNKYVIQQMLKQDGGVIVNCGSIHSFVGKAAVGAYAAAKGGVKLLTETAALDYAARGIRVNAVCPGYIDTPLLNALPPEAKAALVQLHPMGRLGRADEVARAVLFLASDDASFVTGSALLVDGGYTAA